ncbi:MAG: DUF5715 family protein [Gemmatimonadota bacterium]|nr:DUF5715 family protein [Gemmatimonadota bacterium]MDH3426866.1 DUF5715 family protein [Gemmatimonadota bacterium]
MNVRKDTILRCVTFALWISGVAAGLPAAAEGQSLRGSRASLDLQNRMAAAHDFTYLSTSAQVRRFVDAGYLVRVRSNGDYRLKRERAAYARPEVALFIERLAKQYRAACGEQLVVTSLTRPRSRQPRNASPRSVHPTGMAVDLRRSGSRACRGWLEGTLLQLEEAGVLEATRESRPFHYHVAVFPNQYTRYVESQLASARPSTYRVQAGDSLSAIARRTGTSVTRLATANGLTGTRIYAGQVLQVPAGP